MPENDQQSFLPDYSSELNIESIISAPLVAASKANVVMVTGQTRFLLEYCFNKIKGNNFEPKMINMVMSRNVIDTSKKPGEPGHMQEVKMAFTIPLLCLVPLSSLAIDKVTVDFDLEITSMTSREATMETTSLIDDGEKRNIIDKKVQLHGRISNKRDKRCNDQYQTQSTSRLAVNINAGPLPLPTGVLTILDLYNKAIQPLPLDKQNQ